jgi:hypothetical protein
MAAAAAHPPACTCAQCGAALTGPLLDVAMTWPDCVFALSAEERAVRTWQSADHRPDFIVLDGTRFFVRGLLPVPLEGGAEFRYGVWLEVGADEFRHIYVVWHDDAAYARLRFRARLANALRPWGEQTLSQVVEAAPREVTDRPSIVAVDDARLADVLQAGWDRATYAAVVQAFRG